MAISNILAANATPLLRAFALPCGSQHLARHPKVSQRELRFDLSRVLRESPIARLQISKLTLRHPKRMLHLRSYTRFQPFDLVVDPVEPLAPVQLSPLARSHRDVPLNRSRFASLLNAHIAHISKRNLFFPVQQFMRHGDVVNIRRRALHTVHQARLHIDRMRKLLVTLGCWDEVDHRAFASRLARDEVRCHDGAPLPPELRERLLRECERLALAQQQLAALEKTRQASVPAPARKRSDALARLKGIGEVGASRLALELFWREFSNRRQVGACVGLVPQPYDSGQSQVDQGISRQGNRRVRALLVELAWAGSATSPTVR